MSEVHLFFEMPNLSRSKTDLDNDAEVDEALRNGMPVLVITDRTNAPAVAR